MRLIEQQPSWELHAFLRFNDVKYTTEFTPSFKALGRNLPIIVNGVVVKSKEETFLSNINETAGSSKSIGFDYDHVLAKHLTSVLSDVFNQFVRNNGDNRELVFQSSPTGINFAFGVVHHLQHAVNGDKFDHMPGATEDDLVNQLKRQYSYIQKSLSGSEDKPLAAVFGTDESATARGQADAVLFGHIANALCNPTLAPILSEFKALSTFFLHVCDEFFRVPYVNTSKEDDQTWKVSVDALLANPYVAKSQCGKMFTSVLTSGYRDPVLHHFLPSTRVFRSLQSSAQHSSGAYSTLYLNGAAPDARDLVVHDHCTRFTTVTVDTQLLSPLQIEQSSSALQSAKTLFGLEKSDDGEEVQTVRDSTIVMNGEKSCEEAKVVNVSIYGLVYLGVVATCFIGYIQKSFE